MRMGNIMANASYMSMQTAESCNHLLLWCPVAYNIWTMVYSLLGMYMGGTPVLVPL